MIAAWGVVPSIAVNAVAFFYASVTMTLLRLDPAMRVGARGGGSVLHDAMEGLRYVTRHPGIGPLMLFAATVGMTLRGVTEMLPPYVSLAVRPRRGGAGDVWRAPWVAPRWPAAFWWRSAAASMVWRASRWGAGC